MTPSLSVILPVQSAPGTLAQAVARLLEILPDLTAKFEVLVVDGGSSDQTEDIVQDLARLYPQVRGVRHRGAHTLDEAVQSGLAQCRGDVIFIQEEPAAISPSELRRLWDLHADEQLLLARAPKVSRPLASGLLARLGEWGVALAQAAGERGGLQMIRRQGATDLCQPAEQPRRTVKRISAGERTRVDDRHQALPAQRRHNFLTHLKELALGE